MKSNLNPNGDPDVVSWRGQVEIPSDTSDVLDEVIQRLDALDIGSQFKLLMLVKNRIDLKLSDLAIDLLEEVSPGCALNQALLPMVYCELKQDHNPYFEICINGVFDSEDFMRGLTSMSVTDADMAIRDIDGNFIANKIEKISHDRCIVRIHVDKIRELVVGAQDIEAIAMIFGGRMKGVSA